MPYAGAGHGLSRCQVDVVAGRALIGAHGFRVPEADPDLPLVRALVRGEADVTVDPGEGTAEWLRVRDNLGADLLEAGPSVADEPQARFLDHLHIPLLVLREPFLVVVLRKFREEPEELRREVFGCLAHPSWPPDADMTFCPLNLGANPLVSTTTTISSISRGLDPFATEGRTQSLGLELRGQRTRTRPSPGDPAAD